MKKTKSVIAMFLFLATVFFCISPLTAFAASNDTANTSYTRFDQPETKGDYAYYTGSKMKKSSSTTKSEVKWIQAALNYCVKYEGLKTSYISVDGSFGPATQKATKAFQKAAKLTQDGSFGPDTIKKMISVLNDGKKHLPLLHHRLPARIFLLCVRLRILTKSVAQNIIWQR